MQRKKTDKKKVGLIAGLAAVIVALTALIGFLLWNDSKKIVSVSMSFTRNLVVDTEEENWDVKEEKEVSFFYDVVHSGSVIHETALEPEEYRHLKMVFNRKSGKNPESFELLLSDSVNNCLYLDADGVLYLIPESKAQELLIHPQITALAMSFASPPVCSLSARGVETPTYTYTGEWTYTKVDGTQATIELVEAGDQTAVLPADENQGDPLAFTFSLEPDYCSIRVLDEKGNMIYSGDTGDMDPLSYEEDTDLKVSVFAEWHQADNKNYKGSITYEFDVRYDVETICALTREAVRPGESFEIRVAHSSADEVGVTATFLTENVTQTKEGKEIVVRVPVAPGVTAGSYEIILMGADVETTLKVTVLEPEA